MIMEDVETIEIDGYVGRIVIDECPSVPDHDGMAHVYDVYDGEHVETLHADSSRTREADDLRGALVNALQRYGTRGTDWDKIERYLRTYHDVVSFDRTDWDRGALVCIVTGALADKWGCPTDARPESATQALRTWQAYRDDEVYGYTVESPSGDDLDSCFGYYGDDELPYIRDQIADVIKRDRADVHAARVAMYRAAVDAR